MFLSLIGVAAVEASPMKGATRKVAQIQMITFEDRVRSVEKEDAFYRITFWRHAAYYSMSKGNPDSESLLKALNQSKDKGTAVKLEVDANTLEILKLSKE